MPLAVEHTDSTHVSELRDTPEGVVVSKKTYIRKDAPLRRSGKRT